MNRYPGVSLFRGFNLTNNIHIIHFYFYQIAGAIFCPKARKKTHKVRLVSKTELVSVVPHGVGLHFVKVLIYSPRWRYNKVNFSVYVLYTCGDSRKKEQYFYLRLF